MVKMSESYSKNLSYLRKKMLITLLSAIFLLAIGILSFIKGYELINKPILAVLLFHEVVPNPEKPWEITLEQLKNIVDKAISMDYKFINPDKFERMMAEGFEGKNLMVTFDDGIEKQIEAVKFLYREYGIRSVVFLLENDINKPEYMSTEQILALKNDYGTVFGLHGRFHERYTEQLEKGKDLGAITEEARTNLNSQLNMNITWLSYPFGDYSSKVIEELKSKTAINLAFTIEAGKVSLGDNSMAINRYMYMGNDSPDKVDPIIDYGLLPPEEHKNGNLIKNLSFLIIAFAFTRFILFLKEYKKVKKNKQNDL